MMPTDATFLGLSGSLAFFLVLTLSVVLFARTASR
jgi:hypothetical protein